MGDLPPEPLPAVMLESGIQSDSVLQRRGATTETSTYAPFVAEGSIYNTSKGDRVRVVSSVATPDGISEVITESIDIGLARPVAVGAAPQAQYYELTDAEREAQAAQASAHNAAVLEAALNATAAQSEAWQAQEAATAQGWADYYAAQQSYSAPSYTSESVPYTSVTPGSGGYVESAPVAGASGSQGTEQLQENTVQTGEPIPGISAALAAASAEPVWIFDGVEWYLSYGGDDSGLF